MSWECAECGVSEGKGRVSVTVVCHHCGKPLCEKHRVAIADDDFWSPTPTERPTAYHCDDCRRRHHPKVR